MSKISFSSTWRGGLSGLEGNEQIQPIFSQADAARLCPWLDRRQQLLGVLRPNRQRQGTVKVGFYPRIITSTLWLEK